MISVRVQILQEQECEFLRSFTAFVASVLVKAWKESDDRADEEVILGSLASLNDEFAWFKKEALKRDIDLTKIVPQNATAGYSRYVSSSASIFLEGMHSECLI